MVLKIIQESLRGEENQEFYLQVVESNLSILIFLLTHRKKHVSLLDICY